MKTLHLLITAAIVALTVTACSADHTPGQDVRLKGYDNLYPAYPVE